MNNEIKIERISISLVMTVLVASLGYFVDVFDLIIFSIVRKQSLVDLGITGTDSLSVGLHLLNWQLAGVLVGGILWGIYGDKRGRLAVLFGSIICYSVANIANAFVHGETAYAICRVLAGLGLAGELGAGVTLVTEVLHKSGYRIIGTMLIAVVGLLGAVAAAIISTHMHWRNVFLTGGIMGLVLLLLRMGVQESRLFMDIHRQGVKKGDIIHLFSEKRRAFKYFSCILADAHMYFVVGILLTGSPEIAAALGVQPVPSAGMVIGTAYLAMSFGDLASGYLSYKLKSRKKPLWVFHVMALVAIVVFLYVPSPTQMGFLAKALFLGFSVGSWAVINANAAEQFGTNLRALAATTVPNAIRALLIPMSFVLDILKPHFGIIHTAALIGGVTITCALFFLYRLEETSGKNLDYIET